MKGELEEEQWLVCASDAQSDRGPGSAHILFWPPGLSATTSTPSAYGRRGPEGTDTGTLSQECDAVAGGTEVVRMESWPKTSNHFFVHWEQNNSGINGPNWNATQGPYWSCGLYFGFQLRRLTITIERDGIKVCTTVILNCQSIIQGNISCKIANVF